MGNLGIAAVSRLVMLKDTTWRWYTTDRLLKMREQTRVCGAVLFEEEAMDGSILVNEKEIRIKDLLQDTEEGVEVEILSRMGAAFDINGGIELIVEDGRRESRQPKVFPVMVGEECVWSFTTTVEVD